MKKITLFFCFLYAFNYNATCQNTYFDAIYMSHYNAGDLNAVLSGVQQIDEDGKSYTTPIGLTVEERTHVRRLTEFYSNGPFSSTEPIDLVYVRTAISKYNKALTDQNIANRKGGYTIANGVFGGSILLGAAGLLPQLLGGGGLSLTADQQTTIIDGITKYYAEEFKKAQMLTYMQGIKKTMDNFPDLVVLFPETFEKLQNTDPTRFPDLGDEYKDIFSKDLKNVLKNSINYIDNYNGAGNPKHILFSNGNVTAIRNNNYYTLMKLSCDVGDKVMNKYPLPDLLSYLDNTYGSPASNRPPIDHSLALVVKGLNALQNELRDTSAGKTWLNAQQFKQLTSTQQQYFAALLYRKYHTLFPQINLTNYANVLNNIVKLQQALIEIEEIRKNFKDKAEEQSFEQLFMSIVKLIDIYNDMLPGPGTISIMAPNHANSIPKDQMMEYIRQAKQVMYIYNSVRKGDYSNIVYYSMQLIKNKIGPGATSNLAEVVEKVSHYGDFMTEIVNAETSEDVKVVIKKFAAPPTSFILKREYKFTASITGQPGYFGSFEWLGNNKKTGLTHGITLPMGADFSFKFRPQSKTSNRREDRENSASISVFVQALDLGAPLNYRIANDTSAGLPVEVTFEQLFSPGVSLVYGFKNSPITLGVGYQKAPKLRNINENGATELANGDRAFVRFAWDIPFINIYKSKEK